ncbi:MAG: alpha/beta fold hydrolase [Candidatus Nanopelagicales bacterium]
MTRRSVGRLGLLLLAAMLALPAVLGLSRADDGLAVRESVVDGVPLTLVEPADPAPPEGWPGVVVAHGFSGSRTLMLPLARGLARAGYAVQLLDFAGHGANPDPLPLDADGTAGTDRLGRDLAVAVEALAGSPGVDPDRLVLLGHSMGAGAVVAYAVSDAQGQERISATVAVSLPSAEDVPDGTPAQPRDLLLLVGAAESARFTDAALGALRAGYPDAQPERTYGDPAAGDARRMHVVPGVEHISIVLSADTLAATLDWLAPVTGGTSGPGQLDPTLRWLLLLTLAAAIAVVPIAGWAYGSVPTRAGPPTAAAPTVRWWWALALALGGAVAASVAAWVLGPLAERVPLAVGGYVAVWFVVAGATVLAVLGATGRGRPWALGSGRVALATVGVVAYAVAALALTGRATWSTWSWVGPRPWLGLLMLVAFGVYFLADEALVARASGWRRAAVAAGTRTIAVVVILGAVVLLGAPGFLVLLLPLMVVLFVLLGWYATVVARHTSVRWAPAAVQAVPLALLVATTFPLASS